MAEENTKFYICIEFSPGYPTIPADLNNGEADMDINLKGISNELDAKVDDGHNVTENNIVNISSNLSETRKRDRNTEHISSETWKNNRDFKEAGHNDGDDFENVNRNDRVVLSDGSYRVGKEGHIDIYARVVLNDDSYKVGKIVKGKSQPVLGKELGQSTFENNIKVPVDRRPMLSNEVRQSIFKDSTKVPVDGIPCKPKDTRETNQTKRYDRTVIEEEAVNERDDQNNTKETVQEKLKDTGRETNQTKSYKRMEREEEAVNETVVHNSSNKTVQEARNSVKRNKPNERMTRLERNRCEILRKKKLWQMTYGNSNEDVKKFTWINTNNALLLGNPFDYLDTDYNHSDRDEQIDKDIKESSNDPLKTRKRNEQNQSSHERSGKPSGPRKEIVEEIEKEQTKKNFKILPPDENNNIGTETVGESNCEENNKRDEDKGTKELTFREHHNGTNSTMTGVDEHKTRLVELSQISSKKPNISKTAARDSLQDVEGRNSQGQTKEIKENTKEEPEKENVEKDLNTRKGTQDLGTNKEHSKDGQNVNDKELNNELTDLTRNTSKPSIANEKTPTNGSTKPTVATNFDYLNATPSRHNEPITKTDDPTQKTNRQPTEGHNVSNENHSEPTSVDKTNKEAVVSMEQKASTQVTEEKSGSHSKPQQNVKESSRETTPVDTNEDTIVMERPEENEDGEFPFLMLDDDVLIRTVLNSALVGIDVENTEDYIHEDTSVPNSPNKIAGYKTTNKNNAGYARTNQNKGGHARIYQNNTGYAIETNHNKARYARTNQNNEGYARTNQNNPRNTVRTNQNTKGYARTNQNNAGHARTNQNNPGNTIRTNQNKRQNGTHNGHKNIVENIGKARDVNNNVDETKMTTPKSDGKYDRAEDKRVAPVTKHDLLETTSERVATIFKRRSRLHPWGLSPLQKIQLALAILRFYALYKRHQNSSRRKVFNKSPYAINGTLCVTHDTEHNKERPKNPQKYKKLMFGKVTLSSTCRRYKKGNSFVQRSVLTRAVSRTASFRQAKSIRLVKLPPMFLSNFVDIRYSFQTTHIERLFLKSIENTSNTSIERGLFRSVQMGRQIKTIYLQTSSCTRSTTISSITSVSSITADTTFEKITLKSSNHFNQNAKIDESSHQFNKNTTMIDESSHHLNENTKMDKTLHYFDDNTDESLHPFDGNNENETDGTQSSGLAEVDKTKVKILRKIYSKTILKEPTKRSTVKEATKKLMVKEATKGDHIKEPAKRPNDGDHIKESAKRPDEREDETKRIETPEAQKETAKRSNEKEDRPKSVENSGVKKTTGNKDHGGVWGNFKVSIDLTKIDPKILEMLMGRKDSSKDNANDKNSNESIENEAKTISIQPTSDDDGNTNILDSKHTTNVRDKIQLNEGNDKIDVQLTENGEVKTAKEPIEELNITEKDQDASKKVTNLPHNENAARSIDHENDKNGKQKEAFTRESDTVGLKKTINVTLKPKTSKYFSQINTPYAPLNSSKNIDVQPESINVLDLRTKESIKRKMDPNDTNKPLRSRAKRFCNDPPSTILPKYVETTPQYVDTTLPQATHTAFNGKFKETRNDFGISRLPDQVTTPHHFQENLCGKMEKVGQLPENNSSSTISQYQEVNNPGNQNNCDEFQDIQNDRPDNSTSSLTLKLPNDAKKISTDPQTNKKSNENQQTYEKSNKNQQAHKKYNESRQTYEMSNVNLQTNDKSNVDPQINDKSNKTPKEISDGIDRLLNLSLKEPNQWNPPKDNPKWNQKDTQAKTPQRDVTQGTIYSKQHNGSNEINTIKQSIGINNSHNFGSKANYSPETINLQGIKLTHTAVDEPHHFTENSNESKVPNINTQGNLFESDIAFPKGSKMNTTTKTQENCTTTNTQGNLSESDIAKVPKESKTNTQISHQGILSERDIAKFPIPWTGSRYNLRRRVQMATMFHTNTQKLEERSSHNMEEPQKRLFIGPFAPPFLVRKG
jgi:hypothetical protein